MSFEERNLKVFLSSSMGEFRDQRAAVRQELDSLGVPSFVFEAEGASGQSPAEIFQEAVRGASVYIGVFGKVCGKYTKEEFEVAWTRKITCHLYVQRLSEEERSEGLKEFLQKLSGVSDVPSIYYFQSDQQLLSQIKRDLWKWMERLVRRGDSGRNQIDVNDNLPILCDRDPQEIDFGDHVASYFKICSTRPLLLILPGHVQERPELYLDRVKLWSLDEYLEEAGITGEKKVLRFRKSLCAMSTPTHVQRETLGLLPGIEIGNDQHIVAYITQAGIKAFLIEIRLLSSECAGSPQKPLQLIADYLAAFPDTRKSVLVGAVVSLEEDDRQGWWNRVWGIVASSKSGMSPFDESISQLKERYRDGSQLHVRVLRRLTSPKVDDVKRWLNHELVKPFAPRMNEQEIEAMFQGRVSLPMDHLYTKLTAILEKRKR